MAGSTGLGKKLEDYILGVPKAELHVHIEGTLEPELVFQLAARNDITVEGTVESLKTRRNNFKVSSTWGRWSTWYACSISLQLHCAGGG